MAEDRQYIQGLDEYIRQGEPQEQERSRAWQTAIGLQEVDGLKTSPYLLETARRHIEGDITISEAKQLIDSYYKSQAGRKETEEERTEEADKVSANITKILSSQTWISVQEDISQYIGAYLKVSSSMQGSCVIMTLQSENGCLMVILSTI